MLSDWKPLWEQFAEWRSVQRQIRELRTDLARDDRICKELNGRDSA